MKNIDIDWYMYMYMLIEFIMSGYTSYTYWFVFISPLDKWFFFYIQLIIKYICVREF